MSREHDPVSRVWRRIAPPSSDELRELARAATSEPQRVELRSPRRRRLRGRWAVIVAAAALLLGSGLGFSLGSSVTPSGSAGRSVVGLGFLPDRGWSVVQRAGATPGTATAVASKDGIVISITSSPRGDPAEDISYAIRQLPLLVSDARAVARDPSRLALRAAVGGYNIEARISLPGALPTATALASAQRQLNRLIVAAARVTMGVRPAISSPATYQVTAFGTIDSSKAGESVTIQAKECNNSFFRVYAGANTEEGGTWSTFIFPSITMKLRAVWNNETSAEVTFRQRVFVRLRQRGATRFELAVGGRFYGKPANIQQFDRRLGRWEIVKRVRLSSDYATNFTLRVPKGTRLRAAFPNALAKPCYLGATSSVIRT